MCLNLKNKSVLMQTAEEDIIVYKYLTISTIHVIEQVKDGDEFIGVIRSIECSGKIHKTEDGSIYLCTNDRCVDGMTSPVKFGYMFSWLLDNSVQSVIVNGIELIDKVIIKRFKYKTPYRSLPITIGETYTSELIKENDKIHVGLHSFADLSSCKYIVDDNNVCVKCIIPKGSHYYEGLFTKWKSYASDKITYLEIIY